MKTAVLAALAIVAVPARAAAPSFVTEDHSSAGLVDKAAVIALWKESLPVARLAKLYPPAKWGFLSQVEGGISNQTCVVTARVVMLPRTSPTRRLVWEPAKMSTSVEARPGATPAQCSELATAKLKEAMASLVSSLVK